MPSRLLKSSSGQLNYAQIVTVFLLVAGVGIAAYFYVAHQRDRETAAGLMDPAGNPVGIEQRLLRELAKSENRSFSDEQVSSLKKELSPHSGERVTIECTLGDLESCYLALEINLVFEASGWIVEEFLFASRRTPGKAVIVRIKDASMMPRAEDLARLLTSAGLSVTTQVDAEMPFDLRIIVPSDKPPSASETPA
jgi:hypothetical protein